MKKILCAFLVIFTLCGCNKIAKNITPHTKGITFNAQATYYNECYECNVEIEQNGDTVITITEPNDIEGLIFSYKGNETLISYKGLEYKTNNNSPEISVADFIYSVFQNPTGDIIKDNDNLYIEGKTKKNNYKLFLGATGLPLKITTTSGGYEVIIKNATIK